MIDNTVSPGNLIDIKARVWNAFLENVEDVERLKKIGPPGIKLDRFAGKILIQNGEDWDMKAQYPILGIDAPITKIDKAESEFFSRRLPIFRGVMPLHPKAWPPPPTAEEIKKGKKQELPFPTLTYQNGHAFRFAIAVKPLKSKEIGPAYMFGTRFVRVNMVDANHEYANILYTPHLTAEQLKDLTDQEKLDRQNASEYLTSVGYGPARILWNGTDKDDVTFREKEKKKGEQYAIPEGTGEMWALVHFGFSRPSLVYKPSTTSKVEPDTQTIIGFPTNVQIRGAERGVNTGKDGKLYISIKKEGNNNIMLAYTSADLRSKAKENTWVWKAVYNVSSFTAGWKSGFAYPSGSGLSGQVYVLTSAESEELVITPKFNNVQWMDSRGTKIGLPFSTKDLNYDYL